MLGSAQSQLLLGDLPAKLGDLPTKHLSHQYHIRVNVSRGADKCVLSV